MTAKQKKEKTMRRCKKEKGTLFSQEKKRRKLSLRDGVCAVDFPSSREILFFTFRCFYLHHLYIFFGDLPTLSLVPKENEKSFSSWRNKWQWWILHVFIFFLTDLFVSWGTAELSVPCVIRIFVLSLFCQKGNVPGSLI